MKRNTRFFVLSLLLVAVLALSACTANLPNALASLTGLTSSHTAIVSAAAPAQIAQAAQGTAPVIAGGDLQAALQSVYETVNPSVVNIRVTQTAGGRSSGTPRTPGQPFGQPGGPRVAQALGSGFVWDRQGHIITNNHVVDGADQIEVTFYDGLSVSATVVGRDPDSDLAVLKVDPAKVSTLRPVAVGDSTQVKVGQFTVAIGNPFGLEGTMTFGIVSALGRTLPANNSNGLTAQNAPTYTIPDVIQTDAPVNPGNSGGVLLDLDGRLIGVPSAIESPAGTSSGIGFAIPSAIVQQVVPALIQTGRYEHPWIGISGTTLTSEMAGAMGLPATQRGTLVVDVTSGSPADKAGLQGSGRQVTIAGSTVRVGGDVIVAVDGRPVQRFEDLTSYLARYGKVGQTIELKVMRDGKEVTLSLTLAARPAQTPQPRSQNQGQQSQPQGNAWLGVSGVTLTSELAKAMGLPADQKGVLVEDVVQGSPADKAGIRGSDTSYTLGNRQVLIGGDVIVKAGNQSVETIEALVNTVRGQKPGDTLALVLLRDGKEMTLSVTLAVRPTQTP